MENYFNQTLSLTVKKLDTPIDFNHLQLSQHLRIYIITSIGYVSVSTLVYIIISLGYVYVLTPRKNLQLGQHGQNCQQLH